MGSYVLVSHQSQTCSSHYTEPCSTTRTPWLGRSTGSPREGRPEPAQPLDLSMRMTRSCCLKLVRETGMQHVSRPCRRTWMTRKPRKRRYYMWVTFVMNVCDYII